MKRLMFGNKKSFKLQSWPCCLKNCSRAGSCHEKKRNQRTVVLLVISGRFCPWLIKMPNCGTWRVPFRGKFGAYDQGQRVVPAFSVQSLQKATVVQEPPKSRPFSASSRNKRSSTTFRRHVLEKTWIISYSLSHASRFCFFKQSNKEVKVFSKWSTLTVFHKDF